MHVDVLHKLLLRHNVHSYHEFHDHESYRVFKGSDHCFYFDFIHKQLETVEVFRTFRTYNFTPYPNHYKLTRTKNTFVYSDTFIANQEINYWFEETNIQRPMTKSERILFKLRFR